MSKRRLKKLIKKYKKKYKNIALIFLVVISFTLSNYQKYINNQEPEIEKEEQIGYFVAVDKYDVFKKGYAYVKDDNDLEIQSNARLLSYETKVEGDTLNFYKWPDIPDYSYPIIRLSFKNYILLGNNIAINKETTYEDFINSIVITNATYKVFEDETEITEGNIEAGMQLKIYYNEELVDYYDIIDEYFNKENLNIKENTYLINNISTVLNLKNKINTNGIITVLNKEGQVLKDTDYITTNSKIKIELPNNTYEYTIVVPGDVTGSGDIFIGDISKLYQYYKKTITMEKCYVIAGDVTYDNEIEINDIAKLYQYSKGTINSLQ